MQTMLKLYADLFLSGHSEPVDRKAVEGLPAQIEQKQAQVNALIQEGKTLDDVKKALGNAALAAPGARRWPSLVDVIFSELSAKK